MQQAGEPHGLDHVVRELQLACDRLGIAGDRPAVAGGALVAQVELLGDLDGPRHETAGRRGGGRVADGTACQPRGPLVHEWFIRLQCRYSFGKRGGPALRRALGPWEARMSARADM